MKRKKEHEDACEIVVKIPRDLLIRYVKEPVCVMQPKSDCRRWVDYLFRHAIWEYYYNEIVGSDVNGV